METGISLMELYCHLLVYRSVPIGLGRTAQIAVIRRTTATGPTGIYHCGIPTEAVHDNTDILRETVYVGLYVSEGKREISK